MECLDNIVGISRNDCPCVLDGLTPDQVAEMRLSTSGLYLDELPGAVPLRDIKSFESCGEYFRLAKESIKIAKKSLEDDLIIAIAEQYKGKPKYNGAIGNPSYASFLNKTKPYQFMKIVPRTAGDASIQLQNMKLIVSESDAVNFFILAGFENEIPQVIYTTTVNTTANLYTTIPLPPKTTLPTTQDGRVLHYYFVWSGQPATKARDNKLGCGCSGGNAYEDYIYLRGGQSDDLAMITTYEDEFSHGFNINVVISCETSSLVCREYDAKNEIAVATSKALQNKANEVLNELILKSSQISRLTMMSREHLYGKRDHFRVEYQGRIEWLKYSIDVTRSGCWICNQKQMYLGSIFD